MTPDGSVQIMADVARITQLDPNGYPAIGNAVYTTNQFMHFTATPSVETGDDIVTKNASGDIGGRYKHGDMVKFYEVNVELTQPDEMIEALLVGGTLLSDSASALATPGVATATPSSSGGVLATASYYYRVTALSAYGETLPGTESTAAVTTGPTGSVALTWTAVTGAVGYRVYGRTTGAEQFIAQVTTNSYTDTGAITPNGNMPLSNTTAGPGANVGLAAPTLGLVGNASGVSFELWGKAILNGQHRDPLGYRRWVFPLCTNFRNDARSFTNAAIVNAFLGQSFENANWGTGPFGDWKFASTQAWQRARCSKLVVPAPYLGSVPATV